MPARTSDSVLPIQKAAVLLVALGDETSAQLLKLLPEGEVKKLSQQVASLGSVNADLTETVLREFYHMAANRQPVTQGGPEYTRKLLSKALGNEEAERLIRRLPNVADESTDGLERLRKSDPRQLAKCLANEHPQIVALIVSRLGSAQAVNLLASLPAEFRTEVVLRLASLDHIAPEVVSKIALSVAERLTGDESINREAYAGIRSVAELCNRLDPDMAKETLDSIESMNAEMANSIRKLMFVFDDVLNLDDMAMAEIASRVDRKVLVLALKGTSEQIKGHFTKKMSSRARDMLFEDLEALGPVKIKEVEGAQQEIIALIRDLERQGVLSLHATAGDEYVK